LNVHFRIHSGPQQKLLQQRISFFGKLRESDNSDSLKTGGLMDRSRSAITGHFSKHFSSVFGEAQRWPGQSAGSAGSDRRLVLTAPRRAVGRSADEAGTTTGYDPGPLGHADQAGRRPPLRRRSSRSVVHIRGQWPRGCLGTSLRAKVSAKLRLLGRFARSEGGPNVRGIRPCSAIVNPAVIDEAEGAPVGAKALAEAPLHGISAISWLRRLEATLSVGT